MFDEYGLDDPGVPVQPLTKEKPKKLVTRKEFWPLLEEYQKLASDPKTGVQTLEECSKKISDFLEEYNAKMLSSSASTARKVSFLQKFDSRMNAHGPAIARKFYTEYGTSHISSFFKLAFYKELTLGEQPGPLDYSNPEIIKQLDELVPEKKANRIIDSIVAQIFEASTSKELFLAMCDWMIEERRTTHKVIKVIEIFTRIIADIKKKRAKFLQGFLYTFGGMLKAEAFSYLKTVLPAEKYEEVDKYVDNNERMFVRELDKSEVKVFEKHTTGALSKFFESLAAPESMKGAVDSTKLDYLYNITRREFIDEYDNDHKKRPTVINPIESAHYSYMFSLDTLTFYFCFMVKQQEEAKPLKTEDRIAIKKLIESPNKLTDKNLKYEFLMNGSEELVNKIVEVLYEICPDPLTMLRLNRLHLAGEAPGTVLPTRKGKEDPTYERTSKYNQLGMALYSYLLLCSHKSNAPLFPIFITREFMFELYLPSIAALLSVPTTGRLGIDLLHRFVAEEGVAPEKYEATSGFLEVYMGMLLELVNFAGRGGNETTQYMGFVLFPRLMKMVTGGIVAHVYEKLLQKLDEDGAKAMVIDCFKDHILSLNEKPSCDMKEVLTRLFEAHAKEAQSNMLERKQTLNALLTLYKAAILKDTRLKTLGIAKEKEFQESIRKNYTEPINEVAKQMMGEEVKSEQVKLPEEMIEAYKKERNQLELFRFVIADIEASLLVLNNE